MMDRTSAMSPSRGRLASAGTARSPLLRRFVSDRGGHGADARADASRPAITPTALSTERTQQ